MTNYGDLTAFFAENVEQLEECEYVVSRRMKDAEGNPVPWVLRPVSKAQEARAREAAYEYTRSGGTVNKSLNAMTYEINLIVEAVAFPNLRDPQLQNSWGCMNPADLLGKMLSAGEYMALWQKVNDISDFNTTQQEDVEAAKN